MRFLTAEEIVAIGRRVVGEDLNVRDFGLNPYPTLLEKAAALLHSLTTSHPFTDGNKRVAFAATDVFLKLNGARFDPGAEDELFTTVIDIATHALDDVPAITKRIAPLIQAAR